MHAQRAICDRDFRNLRGQRAKAAQEGDAASVPFRQLLFPARELCCRVQHAHGSRVVPKQVPPERQWLLDAAQLILAAKRHNFALS